ncbi:MAG: hypothetical protein AAFN50_11835 [Pseudomonadota bacterium]
MDKKFLISWVAAFVVWMLGSFAVHGAWLNNDYGQLPHMMRTLEDQEALMHFMLLAHVLMAGAFVWIYQRGNEAKSWMQQGVRFGLAIAFMAVIPTYMIYYTVQLMPGALAVKQIVGDTIVVVVVALVTAFLNRRTE